MLSMWHYIYVPFNLKKYNTYNLEKGQIEKYHIMPMLFLTTDLSIEYGWQRDYNLKELYLDQTVSVTDVFSVSIFYCFNVKETYFCHLSDPEGDFISISICSHSSVVFCILFFAYGSLVILKLFFGLKVLLKLKENHSFSSQRKIHLKLHDQYLKNPYLPGVLVKITLRNRNHTTYLSRKNFNIKLFISKIRNRLIVWVKRKLKSKRKARAMDCHLEQVLRLPTLKIEA